MILQRPQRAQRRFLAGRTTFHDDDVLSPFTERGLEKRAVVPVDRDGDRDNVLACVECYDRAVDDGAADWRAIAAVKEAVSIPVVANGDVAKAADAMAILDQSGADAVMIGRSHYGAPWLAGSLAREAGAKDGAGQPDASDLVDYVVAHYEDMLSLYGVESGLRQARKHLGWYLDRHASAVDADTRRRVMTGIDPADVVQALREAFARGVSSGLDEEAA